MVSATRSPAIPLLQIRDFFNRPTWCKATRKRKRRLTLDAGLYERNIFVPEYLEVYDFPDGNFALLLRGRHIGIGFKQTDAGGHVRLYWIKRRDLMRFCNDWQQKIGNALARLAIPPESYAEYPFLRS